MASTQAVQTAKLSIFIIYTLNTLKTDICISVFTLSSFPFISLTFPTPQYLKAKTWQCCPLLLIWGTSSQHIWAAGTQPKFSKWNLPTKWPVMLGPSYSHTQDDQTVYWARVQSLFAFHHFIFRPVAGHYSKVLSL